MAWEPPRTHVAICEKFQSSPKDTAFNPQLEGISSPYSHFSKFVAGPNESRTYLRDVIVLDGYVFATDGFAGVFAEYPPYSHYSCGVLCEDEALALRNPADDGYPTHIVRDIIRANAYPAKASGSIVMPSKWLHSIAAMAVSLERAGNALAHAGNARRLQAVLYLRPQEQQNTTIIGVDVFDTRPAGKDPNPEVLHVTQQVCSKVDDYRAHVAGCVSVATPKSHGKIIGVTLNPHYILRLCKQVHKMSKSWLKVAITTGSTQYDPTLLHFENGLHAVIMPVV